MRFPDEPVTKGVVVHAARATVQVPEQRTRAAERVVEDAADGVAIVIDGLETPELGLSACPGVAYADLATTQARALPALHDVRQAVAIEVDDGSARGEGKHRVVVGRTRRPRGDLGRRGGLTDLCT